MKKLYLFLSGILLSFCVTAQTLDSISPNTGYAGQQNLSTNISATNLFQVVMSPWGNIYDINLRMGANTIPIFDATLVGWPTGDATVVDANNATASFSIPSSAPTGSYNLELTTTDPFFPGSNLQLYNATGAFTVNAPDGYIRGKVYLDQNENGVFDIGETPLANQPMSLQPGNQTANTDANGDYVFGVPNGSYVISRFNQTSHAYVLSSDSSVFNVTVNNADVLDLDFGMVEGLTAISPAVFYQGQITNAIVSSRGLFLTGPNPSGNISSAYIRRTSSPNSQYYFTASNFTILDSSNAHMLYQIPASATLGIYDLVIRLNNISYFLPNAFEIIAAPSYLTGNCYYDANNNGAFDTGEPPVPNVRLHLDPENSLAFSDVTGNFSFGAALTTHTLSYSPTPIGIFTLTTAPSYTFTNTGNQSGFDFGFRSALPDYSADINYIPSLMRCNRDVTSTITYTNTSNVVSQGSVYIIHSSNTTFTSSSPAFSSMNGDTIFFDFSNLQPMETRTIQVTFFNPPNGVVHFNTFIDVVDGLGANQFHKEKAFEATVVCAYDPNDKAAFPEGVDEIMHYTLNYEPLEYLIRFQNTGNDTAFTVYIRDTIDVSFDLNTLEVLAASHSVQTEVDSNRAVVFMFENILLADSVVDEPNSHGYVRYRISPNAILIDPTVVVNTAYIYFDFNPAVVTNTTWNTLVQFIPVGISESIQVNDGVSFYPNPMNEKGYFAFENARSERMILEVFDIKGQRVSVQESKGSIFELDRKGLSSGLYLYRLLNTESGKVRNGKISLE
jgi:hypothetical protein